MAFATGCNKRLDQLSRAMSVHAKEVDDEEDTEVLQWNAIHLSVSCSVHGQGRADTRVY